MMCCSIYAFSILTTISRTTYVSISIEGKQIEILEILTHCGKAPLSSKAAASSPQYLYRPFCFEYHYGIIFAMAFPKVMLGYAFPLLCSVLIGMIGYILNPLFSQF